MSGKWGIQQNYLESTHTCPVTFAIFSIPMGHCGSNCGRNYGRNFYCGSNCARNYARNYSEFCPWGLSYLLHWEIRINISFFYPGPVDLIILDYSLKCLYYFFKWSKALWRHSKPSIQCHPPLHRWTKSQLQYIHLDGQSYGLILQLTMFIRYIQFCEVRGIYNGSINN